MRVITPVTAHKSSSQPDEPTSRTMSAETMKIPEPTMLPATSMVQSNSPSRRWKPCPLAGASADEFMSRAPLRLLASQSQLAVLDAVGEIDAEANQQPDR